MALPQAIISNWYVRAFSFYFIVITGINPKASFGNLLRSKLRDIIPSAARDCSPLGFASGIIRPANFSALRF
jgi:hypothetical protein